MRRNNSALVDSSRGTALLVILAAVKFLLQFSCSGRYGPFRDELYYLACSEHLAWGYIDQPPFIAAVAWFTRHLFGTSLPALRIFPIFAGAGVVLLAGLMAREMGGGTFARILAGAAVLFSPAYLAFDTFLSMNAFEPLFWMTCAYLLLRMLRSGAWRLWLVFGIIAGIGILNKHTMLVFGFALILGLVLSGQRQVFQIKWFWLGGLAAFVIFLPNLLWEARHHWPQIEVVRNAQLFKNSPINLSGFLWEQILFTHPVMFPLWLAGFGWLLFSIPAKQFRCLGWAYLVVMAIFFGLHGKTYYPLPAYPILLAAGGVAFEQYASRRGGEWLKWAYPVVLILGGIVTLPFGVPILPVQTFIRYESVLPLSRSVHTEREPLGPLPQVYADMIGWREMTSQVAGVFHKLPAEQQSRCVVVAGNYGEAAAVDYYGREFGLPKALSGHNNYFLWGPRGYSGECVILFGDRAEQLKLLFGEVERAATIVRPYSMPAEDNLPIYVCRRPRAPLPKLWPAFRYII